VNRAKPDDAELKATFKGYLDENDLVLRDGHKPYRSLATEYEAPSKMSIWKRINTSISTMPIVSIVL